MALNIIRSSSLALQQKWDICLLKNFFSNPHYKTGLTAAIFCREHNLSSKVFSTLKRTPIYNNYNHKNTDIYAFVARYLKPLYKMTDGRDITDCISIALWLKNSEVDALAYTEKDDLQFKYAANQAKTKRMDARQKTSWDLHKKNLENSSARAWQACK